MFVVTTHYTDNDRDFTFLGYDDSSGTRSIQDCKTIEEVIDVINSGLDCENPNVTISICEL